MIDFNYLEECQKALRDEAIKSTDDAKTHTLIQLSAKLREMKPILKIIVNWYENIYNRKEEIMMTKKELYFEGDNENFEESKRILNKHNIKLEDDCITGCFWQSGKDKEIFN